MTATTKASRTRLSPADRKAQLVSCSISAFAEHGVARATHAHVAERAGVSVSAVHSYFRTREDLVAATLEAVETNLMVIVSGIKVEKATPHEALTIMVTGFDQSARDTPDVVRVWLDWSTGFRSDVWPRYLRMQEQLHAIVRRVLARGKRQGLLSPQLNVTAAARLYVGGGHTVVLMRFAGASQREIETLIDHLVESVISIGQSAVRGTAKTPSVNALEADVK